MNKTLSMSMTLMALTLAMPVMPAHAAGMGDNGAMRGMKCKMHEKFLTRKIIDGYMVSFHVMKAQTGQKMGGNRNFMVKVEKGGQVQTGLLVNSKVVYPDKSAASKMMMKMGDWYMASYDMNQGGRYQLMVLFRTPDGNKHFGGVYYPGPNGKVANTRPGV